MIPVEQLIELELCTQEQLEQLRKESLGEEIDPAAVSVDKGIGRLSRLDSMQIEEIRKNSARSRNLRIYELQEALKRMDQGTYGICENCEKWMDYERLKQAPEARCCMGCN